METVEAIAHHEMLVQRSRFLAWAAPVADAEAALAFIAGRRQADASHACWAFRVGQQYRSSDDGEPAGTAGRPILAAIDGQGLDQVAVVVLRWFGGIKLGAGGLVRAYGGCAAQCLRAAPRRPLRAMTGLLITVDFPFEATVRAALASHEAAPERVDYGSGGLCMAVTVPADRRDALCTWLVDACRGAVRLAPESQSS
ncbi:MAG: YigZ family protein [Xanthomonadales bacterium]|nr:YigZ family protein [Xanthomonadales bacterium]